MCKRPIVLALLAFCGAASVSVAPAWARQVPPPPPAPTVPTAASVPQTSAPETPAPQPAQQTSIPPPADRTVVTASVDFRAAIDEALQRNPSVEQAAADILAADALLRQARAATLPALNGQLLHTTIHPVVEFEGVAATPRNQLTASLDLSAPLYAPATWARRTQAQDNKRVAELSSAETRRQVALATAQAYLAIITQKRLAAANLIARDTSRHHFDLATQLFDKGAGSKLNQLRAQQDLSSNEVTLEDSLQAVYTAQEALGVLLARDGPVDASEEPVLDAPPTAADTIATFVRQRADLQFLAAREQAADRVFKDSWKDRMPVVTASFLPQYLTPTGLFSENGSWRLQALMTVPIFDAGQRAGLKAGREAQLRIARSETTAAARQAASEIRVADEGIRSAQRSVAAARAAAQQAHQVVQIVNVSFRTGATTNIEVIDAQRAAQDADTATEVSEDRLRRAKLDLLVSSGRFP